MTEIEIEAKELVKTLLQKRLQGSEITLTLLGQFPLYYLYEKVRNGTEFGINSEDIVTFLLEKKVLTLQKKESASGDYPVRPTKFIVSYDQTLAEEFLYIIKHGAFKWDKRDGTWSYKNNSYSFTPGTGQYRVIDMFMKSPNKHITAEEIQNTFSSNRDDLIKRVANDIVRDIKKPLKIPEKHFIPGDGYTFKSDL